MTKPHLEYLSARGELIEEIECIIADLMEVRREDEDIEPITQRLYDAIDKYFPTTAQDSIQSCWIPKEDAES